MYVHGHLLYKHNHVNSLSSGLFGTDLEQRMEHEKSIIPAIVTRCIQEVELRGEFLAVLFVETIAD